MENKCLFCYKAIENNGADFHPSCSTKIFGTTIAPTLDYSLDDMQELAKKVVQNQITVPGVQAKLSFYFNPKRVHDNRFTFVELWGNYILKPPTKQFKQLPENEDLTMHLAEIFKIQTVPHTLIRLASGEFAYLTKRIDRIKEEKLPMEDLCQLSERLTEDKYKGSMEHVGKTIIKYSSNPQLDALTFFEISLFSFLTGNADMHLKNFSLIDYPTGLTQLSPAYDLLSTRLVISEKEDPEELALTMNGRKRKFKRDDFMQLAKVLKLNAKQVENSFNNFSKSLPKVYDFINQSFLSDDKKEEYCNLISNRANRLSI